MSIFATLAIIFFLSVGLTLFILVVQFLRIIIKNRATIHFWDKFGVRITGFAGCWSVAYALFIIFGTGPKNHEVYPPANLSPFKLPWAAGVNRFVAQGNRSFVSHRDAHLYAFDFWMSIGTEILASRDGKVVKVEDYHEGIGPLSNYVQIKHLDGTSAFYAHIKKNGSVVKVGDEIKQGQHIAYSGMVGQTLFPHLHFVVTGIDGTNSIPISFSDVTEGVPLAGRFYNSNNTPH